MSGCHRRSARRLVRLAERNRGVYVKLGQHASAMEYLLPVEYTQQLQQLQRNAPPSPMPQVEDVLKQELKIDRLDEVFQQFDETPVGAGRCSTSNAIIVGSSSSTGSLLSSGLPRAR